MIRHLRRIWYIIMLCFLCICFGGMGKDSVSTVCAAAEVDEEMSVDELTEKLNSDDVSTKEKNDFMLEYLKSQRSVVMDMVKTLLFALIILLLGIRFVKFCIKLTDKWLKRKEFDIAVQNFVLSFAKVAYYMILIYIVAGILGFGATMVAVIGSAGLAIGLALQGSLANLAGGVLILALKPFTVGDYISADGAEGTVESIDIFYTKIHTTDNKVVVIPNGTITATKITNTTQAQKRMMIIDFRVGYDVDFEQIKQVLLAMLAQEEGICQEDSKAVVIDKLAPLKLHIQLKAWTKTEDYWEVRYRVLEHMKDVLEKQGVSLG